MGHDKGEYLGGLRENLATEVGIIKLSEISTS